MNKNIQRVLFSVVCIALIAIPSVFASDVAATVQLTVKESVSVQDLEARVAQYQKEAAAAGSTLTITPLDVLDVMINDLLIIQGANRDGYAISDAQVETLIAQQKAYLEQQAGQSVTNEQFELAVKQSYGMTLQQFKKAIKDSKEHHF